MSKEKVAIEISKELYDKVVKFVKESGEFKSVEEFVEFVLNEMVSEEEVTLSEEEEEEVKKRLRALGYL